MRRCRLGRSQRKRVKEDSPMKRGLKLVPAKSSASNRWVKEDSPMKRGLKYDRMSDCAVSACRVKEDSPMKRGLKCQPPTARIAQSLR